MCVRVGDDYNELVILLFVCVPHCTALSGGAIVTNGLFHCIDHT